MNPKLFLFLFLVLSGTIQAQIGVVPLDEYADLKKRTLLVVVEEPLPRLVSKLSPEQLAVYNQEIEEYNTLVKGAMETYYKVGNPVAYKTRTEVEAIVARKDRTFMFLENSKFKDNYASKGGFELVQKNRFASEQSRLGGSVSMSSIVTQINIRFPEKSEDALPLYGQYLPNPFPDNADMAYAFRQIAVTFEYREKGITYDKVDKMAKTNGQKLQQLTLLIAEEDLDPKEDREKFLGAYNYPLEIVTRAKIKEAILSHDAKYAYVLLIPQIDRAAEEVKFEFRVADCETGGTLAISKPQDKAGVAAGPMIGLQSMKKAFESKLPPLRKENLWDFARMAK